MDQIYKDYADLRKSIDELEAKREMMAKTIVNSLNEQGLSKKDTKYGMFTIGHRTTWLYSDRVKLLEAKVKIAKDREQKKGTAVPSATEYVTFKAKK